MQPKVSVIIPTYNSAAFIAGTLESVRRQTFDSWEVIVADDCSTDNTRTIVEEFVRTDGRIRLLKLPENSGRPAVPRNLAIREARGQYIALLDSDDLWHPEKLALQIEAMQNNDADFCSTRIKRFKNQVELHDITCEKLTGTTIDLTLLSHERLLRKNTICNSSVVVARGLALEVPFIEDIRYKAIEDFHCWLMMHQHRNMTSIVLELPLTFYRLAESSISRSKFFMLQRNIILYSEYAVGGKKLGMKRFFYLATYIYYSLMRRIFDINFQP
jgi:teichuronic acid biosynthesis glycosyltransferase TuaG